MIVWKGRGILSILVLIIILFAYINLLPESFSDYSIVFSLIVTGIFSWIFGNKWNKQNEILLDETNGQNVKSNHELFWIQLQYWGFIYTFLGIIILFQNSVIAGVVVLVIFVFLIIYNYKNKIFQNNGSESQHISINKPKIEKKISEKPVFQKNEDEYTSLNKQKEITEMTEEELNDYHKKYMPK